MELLRGETLAERLDRELALPIGEVARIVGELALGLVAAHDIGIVHRDLKPANIFLVERVGAAPVAKLLDFGICKHTRSVSRLTGEWELLGTPSYMAPEQLLPDLSGPDPRTDQFALAMVAWEALCGRPPFLADKLQTVFEQIRCNEPPSLSALCPSASPELDRVLCRALSKEPSARFPNVLDFAEALAEAASPASFPSSAPRVVTQRSAEIALGDAFAPTEVNTSISECRSRQARDPVLHCAETLRARR
jgi:serine/threonine-protein kinase